MTKKITSTLMLLVILLGSLVLVGCQKSVSKAVGEEALIKVSYPADDNIRTWGINSDFASNMTAFAASSFIALSDDENNYVYSPMSTYIALSMLYEGSSNNTRSQIADVLGVENDEVLRANIQKAYEYNYFDNDEGITKIANSLWVQNNLNTLDDYTQKLALYYYAEEYKIDFPTQKNCIPKWINYYTNDFLNLDETNYPIDDATILALINTIYFNNNWTDEFEKKDNYDDTFFGSDETLITFMKHRVRSQYISFDNYYTVSDSFQNNYNITYIVPDTGVAIIDLLNEDVLSSYRDPTNQISVYATISLPKIKYNNSYDLKPMLQSLGMTDAFDELDADFTGITPDPLYIDVVKQDSGISFSEKGVEAAAVTFFGGCTSAEVEELDEIEVKLDHPFLYVITDGNNLPVFMGIINNL